MVASYTQYLFFFFLLLLLLAGAMNSSALSAEKPSGAGKNSTEFIRKCCSATLYPGLCYSSLNRYAGVVQQSAVEVAYVATNLTLARLRSLSTHISSLGRNATGRERAALRDCSEVLGDAVDWAKQAVAELKGLDKVVGPEVAWRVSNALTWMSAALTDEDTCTEGFIKLAAGTVKTEVDYRVRKVEKYTSNALALIHILGFSS